MKKHSSRLVGGVETGSQGGKELQGGSWWTGWSHIVVWINWEEQLGSATDCSSNRVPVQGNKASKPLAEKTCGG